MPYPVAAALMLNWRERMRFPDIEIDDLTPDEERTWLTVLLTALGEQSDSVVDRMSNHTVHGMLFNLVNTLHDEEDNLGGKWLHVLQLE